MARLILGKEFKHFKEQVKRMNSHTLEVGFTKESGYHAGAKMSLANLMAIHEKREDKYRRPVMEIASLKIQDGAITDEMAKAVYSYLSKSVKGYRKIERDLKPIGLAAMHEIQSLFGKPMYYKGLSIPSNTPAVIAVKGANTPMIETGKLVAGVKYNIIKRRTVGRR